MPALLGYCSCYCCLCFLARRRKIDSGFRLLVLGVSVPLTKCLISVQESKKLLYGLLIAGGLFKRQQRSVGFVRCLLSVVVSPRLSWLKSCDIFCLASCPVSRPPAN